MESILPKEDRKLKNLCTYRDPYFLEPGERLPYEVEWGLTRIFEQELKNNRNIENSLEILQTSYDYSAIEAFNSIDLDRYGYLDFEW